MTARLAKHRGQIVLIGQPIDDIARSTSIKPAHVVLFTAEEVRHFGDRLAGRLRKVLEIQPLVSLGSGIENDISFTILFWSQGSLARRQMGLPDRHFYLVTEEVAPEKDFSPGVETISEINPLQHDDINRILEGCQALTAPRLYRGNCQDVLTFLVNKHVAILNNTTFDKLWQLLKRCGMSDVADKLAHAFHTARPNAITGHLRMGDSLQRSGHTKRAIFHYAHSAMTALSTSGPDPELNDSKQDVAALAVSSILKCWQHTELGGIFQEQEIQQWRMHRHLFRDNDYIFNDESVPGIRIMIQQHFTNLMNNGLLDIDAFLPRLLSLTAKQPLWVYRGNAHELYKLPRFFRWLIPFRLALMGTPRSREDIVVLRETMLIKTIVTLTAEEPLPKEWFADGLSQNILIPVRDYRAPSIEQVNEFINIMKALPPGEAALVHCGAGKGRTGTFAACYLMACGFGEPCSNGADVSNNRPLYPADAIRLVRHMRPGSLESDEQEHFVRRFGSSIWKPAVKEVESDQRIETAAPLELSGTLAPHTSLVVCCGVPGSGKSTFSRHLATTLGFDVICQDELGTYDACLSALANSVHDRRRVAIDVRNTTPDRRQSWIEHAFLPKDALCVWFDIALETCIARANARPDHQTIPQGKARKIVKSAAREFVAPTEKEKFTCIARVTSAEGAIELLQELGVSKESTVEYVPSAKIELPVRPAAYATSTPTTETTLSKKTFRSFPQTRHLYNLGAATLDDVIGNDSASFLSTADPDVTISLEEKVDGANMGIQLDEASPTGFLVQSRTRFLPEHSNDQFAKANDWVYDHEEGLRNALCTDSEGHVVQPGRYILYGEWMYAKHAILYQSLPDIFLAFDIFDTESEAFLSRDAIARRLQGTGIHQVPAVPFSDVLTDASLQDLVRTLPSAYSDGLVEGIYLRREKDEKMVDRAKIVRRDFKAGNEKWVRSGKRGMVLNQVVSS